MSHTAHTTKCKRNCHSTVNHKRHFVTGDE